MKRIILDTEASGGSVKGGARGVEIGAVETVDHAPTGKVFHAYIDPRQPIEWGATRIHGLTAGSLKGMPVFRDIASELLSFLGNSPILAHGAKFDKQLLASEFSSCAIPGPSAARWSCTQAIIRKHAPQELVGLEAVAARLSIEFPGKPLHGALADAAVLAAILARLHGAPEVDTRELVTLGKPFPGRPARRIGFASQSKKEVTQ